MKLTSYNFQSFAKNISYPSDPEEYCEAAVERLMEVLSPYVVDVKNIRYQFSAKNRIRLIDFSSPESRQRYEAAYAAYLAAMGRAEERGGGGFARIVEDMKFAQAAEIERCPWFAEEMYHSVQEGYAAVCAAKFKATLAKTAWILHKEYGVSRDNISMIWGGDKMYSGQEKYLTSDEIQNILLEAANGNADKKQLLKIKKQILASLAGIGEIPSSMRLDNQSAEDRQKEIINFQSGKSLYCLYSFKSGGVGLSLHHTDEYTKEKVRRKKESNYAVEEDIPLIPTRPRRSFIAPTYSAIELVQGLGRCPRITSLSDTIQELVFYRNTIEHSIASVVGLKLKCLRKVVRKKETWQDMILEGYKPEKITEVSNELVEMDNGLSIDEDEEDEDGD